LIGDVDHSLEKNYIKKDMNFCFFAYLSFLSHLTYHTDIFECF